MDRRDFLKTTLAVGAAGTRLLAQPSTTDTDYVVVGSGAGGGTVAARLAEAGYTVLVLEAGGDPRLMDRANYEVPAFHPFATESPAMRWDFFVRHYADLAQQKRDPKFRADHDGVWYPRAGTLGGCTAHNALIFSYPSDSDWNQIADLTGDPSWRAPAMWQYFQRIENCQYRPLDRLWHHLGADSTGHGWSGWLMVDKPDVASAIGDNQLRHAMALSIHNGLKELGLPSVARLESLFDPNDRRVVVNDEPGMRYTPLTANRQGRVGARERLLAVAEKHPDRLRIETNALATRVILDERRRAVGVEYQKGERLYSAHANPSTAPVETRTAAARREVIVAGGAFNTPQLLMLSGIGDPAVLRAAGVAPLVPLPGVGRNLQDRYEVAVVSRMKKDWDVLSGATFTAKDRQYQDWAQNGQGVYATNGVLLSVVQRSSVGRPIPDLFCYALIAGFHGYEPGYSEFIRQNHDRLTWVVLKGHTNNRGGTVKITSADPRQRPAINFHYFEEGTDGLGDDLDAVVAGIKLVRRMTQGMKPDLVAREESPGEGVVTDDDLRQFVRDQAWGHHASCTCPIGAAARDGVLTTDFKVHGTERLRVVDASVFPRIPGLFIASAVYMVGEKAADAIVGEATRAGC